MQLPPSSRVADLGTFLGYSAVALAANPDVIVTTYDTMDCVPTEKCTYKKLPNIRFVQGDCKKYIEDLVNCEVIFLDTDPHLGNDEREIVDQLSKKSYRGILICDDIYLNGSMKAFWQDVTLKKYDVTSYGHWSGTGIIVFDEQYISVEVE